MSFQFSCGFGNLRVSRILLASAVALTVALSACEQRVVRYDPFLGGLPGAESQTPVARNLGEYQDPSRVMGSITVENPDGTKTLVARSGLHLMIHLYNTLLDDEKKLFVDQVLSERTRQEYIARNIDPGELFEKLVREFDDLETLCLLMPAGEYTPGLFLKPLGGRIKRLELDKTTAQGLRFRGFDMVMEQGNYRLFRVIEQKGAAASRPQGNRPKQMVPIKDTTEVPDDESETQSPLIPANSGLPGSSPPK